MQFIYQEFNRKTNCFKIWVDEDFWIKWFDREITENNSDVENSNIILENTFKNIKKNSDDFYFATLISVSTVMKDLNLDLNFIINCIINKLAKKYISDVYTIITVII